MRHYFPLLAFLILLAAVPAVAEQTAEHPNQLKDRQPHAKRKGCDIDPVQCKGGAESCTPEMRGRCGKQRGDWYGARQPVPTAADAHELLRNYFAGKNYTVSEVIEKKWGFKADILDRSGTVIDRVMIDKRSGRIRSLY